MAMGGVSSHIESAKAQESALSRSIVVGEVANSDPSTQFVPPPSISLGDSLQFGPIHEGSAGEIAAIDAEWNPLPWGAELFKSECNNQVSCRYGAYADGKLVGYLFSHVVLDSAHIVSFGVHRLWRGRGIGAGLLVHTLGVMRRQGVDAITLEVRASNVAARALYEKTGFFAVGIRRKYYSDNGEDAITMRCGNDSL